MLEVIRPALVYFAFVIGAGFLLGMVRVPFLVPRIGERWAELAEMPVMAGVIFLAAAYVLRKFPAIVVRSLSLLVGFLALTFAVGAELVLALAIQSHTLGEYVASRDRVSGSVYVVMLIVFALMPRLRLPRRDAPR